MQTKEWNKHYKNGVYLQWWPNETIVAEFTRLFKTCNLDNEGLGNILDFGCGNGRHCRFLLEQSKRFQVPISLYGVDISNESIKIAKQFLCNLFPETSFNLKSYDGKTIQCDSNFFDIVFSVAVLDQLKFEDAQMLCNEVYRVIKPSGKFIVDLELLPNDFPLDKHLKVEENTFVIDSDCEKGIFQHYFTNNELNKLFEQWSRWGFLQKYTSSQYDDVGKLIRFNERSLIIVEK